MHTPIERTNHKHQPKNNPLVKILLLTAAACLALTSCGQKNDTRTKREEIIKTRYGGTKANLNTVAQYYLALDAAYYSEKPTKTQLMNVYKGQLCMYEYFTENVASKEIKYIDDLFTKNDKMITLYNKVMQSINELPSEEKLALKPPYCNEVK